uniref:cysteine dioxygenase n=1 Tax=Oryza sativa subsp. japonica TaxID=39947 RepID=Q84YM0_ORYSJ|nr:HGWP repeat containing protein-like [Oryza sativa Japonica Group]
MSPLLGAYDFAAGLPPQPPTGVFACTAGLLCRRSWAFTSSPTGLPSPPPTGVSTYMAGLLCRRWWASTTSPPACLRSRQLFFRLHGWPIMPPFMGVHVFTDRLAFAAADWCLRVHGWPIMPLLVGVYDFTAGLPPQPPTVVFACTAGLLCCRSWVFTSSPTSLPSPPPTGVSACTAGLLCRRCWASTSSPTGRLVRRRLVFPPARLAYYAAVVGRLHHHRPAASYTTDWCFRLHSWPVMTPTDAIFFTAGLLCRRWWASSLSPSTAFVAADWIQIQICIKGIHGFKLIPYAPGMDQSEHHRRLAFAAADCWPIMPLLLGVYVFFDRPLRPPPTSVFVYTVGWSHHRCWASTSSPPACLCRRRIVSPLARLAYYAAVVGRLRLHHRFAFAAADWCLRLHDWPIMPPLLDVYIFTDRPPRMTPTGAIVFTAGHVAAATANRRHHFQCKLSTSAADWFPHFHDCMILPVLVDLIVFTAGRLVCC